MWSLSTSEERASVSARMPPHHPVPITATSICCTLGVPFRSLEFVIRGLDPRIHLETVIPGREPCAKLTKSILSLGERTRNPEQCMVLDSGFVAIGPLSAARWRRPGMTAAPSLRLDADFVDHGFPLPRLLLQHGGERLGRSHPGFHADGVQAGADVGGVEAVVNGAVQPFDDRRRRACRRKQAEDDFGRETGNPQL